MENFRLGSARLGGLGGMVGLMNSGSDLHGNATIDKGLMSVSDHISI